VKHVLKGVIERDEVQSYQLTSEGGGEMSLELEIRNRRYLTLIPRTERNEKPSYSIPPWADLFSVESILNRVGI